MSNCTHEIGSRSAQYLCAPNSAHVTLTTSAVFVRVGAILLVRRRRRKCFPWRCPHGRRSPGQSAGRVWKRRGKRRRETRRKTERGSNKEQTINRSPWMTRRWNDARIQTLEPCSVDAHQLWGVNCMRKKTCEVYLSTVRERVRRIRTVGSDGLHQMHSREVLCDGSVWTLETYWAALQEDNKARTACLVEEARAQEGDMARSARGANVESTWHDKLKRAVTHFFTLTTETDRSERSIPKFWCKHPRGKRTTWKYARCNTRKTSLVKHSIGYLWECWWTSRVETWRDMNKAEYYNFKESFVSGQRVKHDAGVTIRPRIISEFRCALRQREYIL